MGTGCTKQSNKVMQATSNRNGSLEVPITCREMELLRESWPHVKPKWNSICAVAFERYSILSKKIVFLLDFMRSFEIHSF